MKNYVIVLASGIGSRFGTELPKQFTVIAGKTVLAHTLCACDCGLFNQIILAVSNEYLSLATEIVNSLNLALPIEIVAGGASRIESCKKALAAIQANDGLVVIHNAAQPLVKKETFEACLNALQSAKAVVSAIPSVYMIMQKGENNFVKSIPDRANLCVDMGVEGFQIKFLKSFFSTPGNEYGSASIVGNVIKAFPSAVKIYEGDPGNIKITYANDAVLAEIELKKRMGEMSHA